MELILEVREKDGKFEVGYKGHEEPEETFDNRDDADACFLEFEIEDAAVQMLDALREKFPQVARHDLKEAIVIAIENNI